MEIDPYANVVGVQVGRANYQINQTNAFNIRAGRDVQIGYSGEAYLFDFLVHSCERILRQLGRSEISVEMRDQVSEEISKVLKMAVDRRQHPGERAGAAADQVIKTAGFLEALAAHLDHNGLSGATAGERLIHAIRDEASELISVVGGAPRG